VLAPAVQPARCLQRRHVTPVEVWIGPNDPIVGANDPGTSWFDLPLKSGGKIRLPGFPEFVSTRGGAYTFLPSLKAIRFLGSL
jgi:hypothetical protein